jgi:hypothetical protein
VRRLQRIFEDLNVRCFEGQLPHFSVRRFKAGAEAAYCDVSNQTISVPVDEPDVEAAILHEMVHAVTGGDHDEAFLGELRRVAALGEPAASRELSREEWHAAGAREGARLAREEPALSPAKVRQRIIAKVGPYPDVPDGYPARAMNAWRRALRDSTTTPE